MIGPTALVGGTGFVGSNIARRRDFDLVVGSRRAREVRGGRFAHVVFSAARAEKWRANADPEADRAHIEDLIDLLGSFRADRLTLISTVDVHREPAHVDEGSAVDVRGLHQYGAGRRALEAAAVAAHPRVAVVRLPALHGPGLKKNVLFDLLNGNQLEQIQPASRFQYYDLTRLADDIDTIWAAGLPLVHLVTEPVSTAQVMDVAFGVEPPGEKPTGPVVDYDVCTRHAELFGASGDYLADASTVLQRIKAFVARARSAGAAVA